MDSAAKSGPPGLGRACGPLLARSMYLVLSVGKRRYAIDSGVVREILGGRPLATVPVAGRSVSGTVFLRGTCITVFDLGWKLTGHSIVSSRRSRVVVLREPKWAAFLVDGVIALARDCTGQTADPDRSPGRDAPFIAGSVEWNQRALAVLDVQGILGSERPPEASRGILGSAVDGEA